LDSLGNLKWTKTVGGVGDDFGQSIIQTEDGGYAITGYTKSFGAGGYDVYVVKADSLGNLLWTKTIGGINDDLGWSIIQTKENDLVIAGYTASYGEGNNDVYIIKLDSSGFLKWSRTVGGVGDDLGYSIIQNKKSDYVIAGISGSYSNNVYDVFVIDVDTSCTIKWTRTIGHIVASEGQSIVECKDGGYAIAGNCYDSILHGSDVYIVRLDSLGNLKWTNSTGGTSDDYSYSIVQTKDNGFFVTGYTGSYGSGIDDVYVVKFDSNGNTCQPRFSIGHITSVDSGIVGSGGLTNAGGTGGIGGIAKYGGVRTVICDTTITTIKNADSEFKLINLFPNPGKGKLTIKFSDISGQYSVEVFDVLGQQIYSTYNIDKPIFNLDLSSKADGVYFYRIMKNDGSPIVDGKFVIER